MRSPAVLIAAAVALSGCVSPRYLGPSPGELGAGAPRCRVGTGRSNLLVTEWSASEKANLEAQLRTGAVAVEYTGCSMRVLTQCRVRGAYGWQATTPTSDVVTISDEDELWAKLPLGAVSLEGDLKASGKLSIATTVSGLFRLEGATAGDVPAEGECSRATHLVGAIAVGAFALDGTGASGAGARASAASWGAGASTSRSAGVIRAAGDRQTCFQDGAAGPSAGCRSPIQVFLWPIPGRAADEGPPGTVKVDLVSANAAARWDVYYDDQVVCTTPCSRWLDPARPLYLRTRDEGSYYSRPDRIRVHDLERYAGDGALQLQAHPTSQGQLATGVVFTTFSGMATATGIVLTAVGCSGGGAASPGLCGGGLTTLGLGGVALWTSIKLILDSRAHAELLPGGGGRSFTVGPGFVRGQF
jgi:hypothetical protein